ncbi:hypothetical protein [Thauera sinica]|uniref:Cytochrome c domain-containing protein n=1 Tax=Thauera sinica TaxID=2665146 RepID=A0ABW1AMF9_9RHOO|nr:hypothetical protein [Thauera sp. K11]
MMIRNTLAHIATALLAAMPGTAAAEAGPAAAQTAADAGTIERGRYMVRIAGCNDCHTPTYAQTGGRVAADRRGLTILLSAAASAGLIDDVRRNGAIAVVFSLPTDHHTLQFKGSDARVVPLEPSDEALAARYVGAFASGLEPLGYPGRIIRRLLACRVRNTPLAEGIIAGTAAATALHPVEHAFGSLKAPVRRLAGPDAPPPASYPLEQAFVPDAVQRSFAAMNCSARL